MNNFKYPYLLPLLLAVTMPNALSAEPPETPHPLAEVYEARIFEDGDGGSIPYRLMLPVDYDPQQQYPLVLCLHGAGERGDDNVKQFIHCLADIAEPEVRQRYPAFVVAPQCPEGARWAEIDWASKQHKMTEQPAEPMKKVLKLLDALQDEYPIDDERVYAVGLSMGGYGVWDLMQREPELLAAAVPVCGGGDKSQGEAIAQIPVWIFHGAKDTVVPVERSRQMVVAILDAGGKPIYTEYPDVGHDSWKPAFANRATWDWLFSQRK